MCLLTGHAIAVIMDLLHLIPSVDIWQDREKISLNALYPVQSIILKKNTIMLGVTGTGLLSGAVMSMITTMKNVEYRIPIKQILRHLPDFRELNS